MSASVGCPAKAHAHGAPLATAGETPMAARTWEGCTLPDEQAAPDDTRDPFEVEGDDRRLGLHAFEREQRRVRQPLGAGAENHGLRRDRLRPPPGGPATPACGAASSARLHATPLRRPRRSRQCRRHSRCRRACRAPARRRGSADRRGECPRCAASARRRPWDRRSCAPRGSEDRRRAPRYRRGFGRPPAPHRHAASRPPHGRSRPPPRPAA